MLIVQLDQEVLNHLTLQALLEVQTCQADALYGQIAVMRMLNAAAVEADLHATRIDRDRLVASLGKMFGALEQLTHAIGPLTPDQEQSQKDALAYLKEVRARTFATVV